MSEPTLFELLEHEAVSEARSLLARRPGAVLDADAVGALPLHHAARLDRPRFAAMLLEAGAPLEARDKRHDSTALAWAAYYGSLASVVVLLRAGADVTVSNLYRLTPLQIALGGLRGEHAADCPDRTAADFAAIVELLAPS